MEELISVIVPIYNAEKYLKRCIESIINQTYKNMEIILINDGSKDNSKKICNEFLEKDCRIKLINKENEGVSAARNYGINVAIGKYISFVDADDWLEKNFLLEMYNKLKEYNVDYVTCGYNRAYDNCVKMLNNDLKEELVSPNEYIIKILNVQNGYGFAHMKLIRKNAIGNIRFNTNISVGEDAFFNIQLCKKIDKFLIYNKALYNYYFNQNSVVRNYDKNYCNKYLNSMNLMNSYIRNNYLDSEVIQNLYNYIAYHILLICVNYCYHPENNNKSIKLIREVCNIELFKKSIKNSNYKNLSITRKVSLFSLKNRLYVIMALICIIRQKQFRK